MVFNDIGLRTCHQAMSYRPFHFVAQLLLLCYFDKKNFQCFVCKIFHSKMYSILFSQKFSTQKIINIDVLLKFFQNRILSVMERKVQKAKEANWLELISAQIFEFHARQEEFLQFTKIRNIKKVQLQRMYNNFMAYAFFYQILFKIFIIHNSYLFGIKGLLNTIVGKKPLTLFQTFKRE